MPKLQQNRNSQKRKIYKAYLNYINMVGKSKISIGEEAYNILKLFDQEKTINEIREITNKTYQNINSFKKKLENYGWIIKEYRGKYKITENGKDLLNLIDRVKR
jgi:predicted transcriptional regulator